MGRRGFCRKVAVGLCGQTVVPKRTYIHSCTGFHVGFPSCRVPASGPASSLHAATSASTAAVARLAQSEGPTAVTIPFRRKICAAPGACGNRLAVPAIRPTATEAEKQQTHRVVVSCFRGSLTEISTRTRLKTGCAIWLASALVPLFLPLRLFPTSERVTLTVHSTLLTLARAASSSTTPVAAYYSTAAARRGRSAAAAPCEKGTAYYEGLRATHTQVPGKIASQQVSSRLAANSRNSSHQSSSSSSVSQGRKRSTWGGTSSNNRGLDSSTSWYRGAEAALSRPRRASSSLSFISQLSLPGRSWRVAPRHSRLHATAATAAVATGNAAAYTTSGSAAPTAISKAQATHSSHARRGTMATMDGFDPKDPHQAADVVLVPVLSDNYAYLLIDRETRKAACVDPAEPQKVLQAAAKEGVELSLCLCTHKHHDHSGGNVELARLVPKIEIVGSAYEETPGVNRRLENKETVNLGDLRIEALHAPCHTSGHLLYFVTNARHPTLAPILFCGDTLFIGGCGRFFEGSAQQMQHALNDICGSLPPNTRVYCGHEYTTTNLEFALTIEPDNQDLQAKYAWTKHQRSKGLPTVPSTIAQEKCYNPFMRTDTNSVQLAVGALGDPNETMRLLRQKKDAFR